MMSVGMVPLMSPVLRSVELWPKLGDGAVKGGVSRRVTSLPEPPEGAIRRDE
jgi:hypothetical protein